MLDRSFTPNNIPSLGYDLTLKADTDWRGSSFRVLIILQTVSTEDLKAQELVSTDHLKHCINYAKGHARLYEPIKNPSFAVCNFNDRKHLNLQGHARAEAESHFKARVVKLIAHLNPTHILFSGDASLVFHIANAPQKNGWVHEIDGRKVTSTLDFSRLLEKQGASANLLGFWCRHLAYLLLGKLPHSLAHLKPRASYVDTIAKFDKVMALFDKAKVAAVDTETKNLSVLRNAIYTIQFAFDSDKERGFFIPVDHPHLDNPFTEEERVYIKKELRKRLGAKEGPELVTQYGIFDLRVIRRALDLDIIYLPVWEIMAGEHLIDENISSLSNFGVSSGGLAQIFCSYGNDSYISGTMGFSKGDRGNIGIVSPEDKDFQFYGGLDVISIINMRDSQIEKAGYQEINGKNWRPYFIRHMVHQMSDTVHQLSHLKDAGSLIDKKYLRKLIAPGSKLTQAIDELLDDFKTFPEVVKANQQILDDSGFKANSLFGGKTAQWVFSFTKPAHKSLLFFNVMGLKPVSQTKTGADAVDKKFIDHYKDRNFLVSKFGEFQQATKLLGTYAKGWYKKLTTEIDGVEDSHLRADYKFFDVDTGRLASADPNLQNIPARGKLAKIIKEMFITPDGHLLIRFDYSAHEVRGWAIVSKDKVLAAAFQTGQKLRQLWIKTPTPEILARLKREGDIHIQNCFRFFQKWVEKSDPLRDAVKSVAFGTLYGMSAATLGVATKKAQFDAIKAEINAANKAGDKKALAADEEKYRILDEEDREGYAQNIIDKMMGEFAKGALWVTKMQESATEQFMVYSPIGRIRHLYAAMTRDRRIVSKQVRRGMNAPIQGFASEIAVKASRLVTVSYYTNMRPLAKLLGLAKTRFPIKFNRIVHDASYFTVPLEMAIPFIHMLQWDMTYGIAQKYEEQFGLKFVVEPEIEIEIGVKDTLTKKFDWSLNDMTTKLIASVDEGIALGIYKERTREEMLSIIFAPWKNKESREFLQTNYPMLAVRDLDDQIDEALRLVAKSRKEGPPKPEPEGAKK